MPNKKHNTIAAFCVSLTMLLCSITPAAADPVAVCGHEEHAHTQECFAIWLVCGKEETNGHIHTDTCCEEQPILVCEEPESDTHQHTEECYELSKVLICGETECAEHHHTTECWEGEPKPICGIQEHQHTAACMSYKQAGRENQEIWNKMFADFEYTGDWSKDLVAVAQSQLGYKESTINFEVTLDSVRHGYTRYSHWINLVRNGRETQYGAYEWWCADFVSFCLHYAKIDPKQMPPHINCQCMVNLLNDRGYYIPYSINKQGQANYTPKPGDLVFFEYTRDGKADHVGIVKEYRQATVIDGEEHPAMIITIEGNNKQMVKECEYAYNDRMLMGFADTEQAFLTHTRIEEHIAAIKAALQNDPQPALLPEN